MFFLFLLFESRIFCILLTYSKQFQTILNCSTEKSSFFYTNLNSSKLFSLLLNSSNLIWRPTKKSRNRRKWNFSYTKKNKQKFPTKTSYKKKTKSLWKKWNERTKKYVAPRHQDYKKKFRMKNEFIQLNKIINKKTLNKTNTNIH